MSEFVFVIPNLKLTSELNAREHWATKARRVRAQRELVFYTAYNLRTEASARKTRPSTVVITRIAPRELDTDNLTGSAKGVRDELAHLMGFDDRDKSVDWVVEQRKGKEYAVEIKVVWL